MKKAILEQYDLQYLVKLYEENKTLQDTAIKLGVCIETLRKHFIKHGIKYDLRQKYTCNHNLFSDDNEASFYWAGFIAADGGLEKNRIKIELAVCDVGHLEKFKSASQTTAPIKFYEREETRPQFKQKLYKSCAIRVSSEQMKKDLLRFGVTANKSKTYNMPDWILEHPLCNHFLRGLIDGDGWSYIEGGASVIGLSGTRFTINKIFSYFVDKLNNMQHYIREDLLEIIQCSNLDDNTKIINFLLQDATICLDRKHQVQLDILKIIPRKLDITQETLINLLQNDPLIVGKTTEKCKQIGETLGCSTATIKRRLVEYGMYNSIKKT